MIAKLMPLMMRTAEETGLTPPKLRLQTPCASLHGPPVFESWPACVKKFWNSVAEYELGPTPESPL